MQIKFSPEEVKKQFRASMIEMNASPDNNYELIADGNIHRYHIMGDKLSSKNGAYVLHIDDGCPAGFIQNWKGEKRNWKFNADNSSLTQEERNYYKSTEYQKKIEEKQRERLEELRRKQEEASEKARQVFNKCISSPVLETPYSRRKDVKPYGARFCSKDRNCDILVVPLYNIDEKIQSLQYIDKDGNKNFFPNAPTSGAFFPIGFHSIKNGDPILFCEGFATGSKIHELTGLPTVCAMNCDNVSNVIKAFKSSPKYGNRHFIVMTDNDIETEKKKKFNPGINAGKKAFEAGNAIGYITPSFNYEKPEGTDWDDYALIHGNQEAAQVMNEQIRKLLENATNETQAKNTQENAPIEASATNEEQNETANEFAKFDKIRSEFNPNAHYKTEFIANRFPRGHISIIAAPPDTGKSLTLERLCADLSKGGEIFGGISYEEKPKKSIIVTAELPEEVLIERNDDFNFGIDFNYVEIIDADKYAEQGISLDLYDKNFSNGRDNIEHLAQTKDLDVLVLDSLGALFSGKENDNQALIQTFKWLKSIARKYNIAVIVVHHIRKRLSNERKNPLELDDVIGGSAITRYCAVAYALEYDKNYGMNIIRTLKFWYKNRPKSIGYKAYTDLYGNSHLDITLDLEKIAPQTQGQNQINSATFNRWQILDAFLQGKGKEGASVKEMTDFLKTSTGENKKIDEEVSRRVKAGKLRRISRGVYALPENEIIQKPNEENQTDLADSHSYENQQKNESTPIKAQIEMKKTLEPTEENIRAFFKKVRFPEIPSEAKKKAEQKGEKFRPYEDSLTSLEKSIKSDINSDEVKQVLRKVRDDFIETFVAA